MAGFALSGIFSGIDTDVLVAATMNAARAPVNRLNTQKNSWQSKMTAVEQIERRMGQLQDLVENLRDADDLRQVNAFSSDRDMMTASASGGAVEGVHEVIINQLAQADRKVSTGVTPTETWLHDTAVADADDEYIAAADISDNAGADYQFVFQFGSETQVAVDLSGYDATGITLNELVAEINTAAGYTAASAASVNGQYNLQIQAQVSGGSKDLVITDTNSVGVLDATDDFAQTIDGDVGTDAIVGAGTFAYTYDGVTRTVTTTADTTLGGLQGLINNDAENPGVVASVLEYQGGTGGRYHLVLSGKNTGADYAVAIEAASTLTNFTAADWTQTQAAQNSQIRVDGYPSDAWIENASNTVTTAIPNVTLNLLATNGAGTLMVADVADASVLTAQAQSSANPGTYEVQVNQLARAEREAHTTGLISTGSLVGAGDFVYSYNGVTRTVTADAATTLSGLRDLINDDTGNPGVTATVLQYGGMHHLVLDGEDTGADYGIAITGATTLTGFEQADFSETAALNAQFKVNGFPSGASWIERSSNAITDAVPGADIALKSTGTTTVTVGMPDSNDLTPITVNLNRDTDELKSDLNNLVSIYNGIVDTVGQYAGYDPDTDSAGVLLGDSGLNLLLSQIRSLVTRPQSGFSSTGDTYTMPTDIGLEIDKDGHLSLDGATLDTALSDDYFGVLELIGAAGIGGADESYIQFNSADASTEAGTYEVQVEFDGSGNVTAASFRTLGEVTWRPATFDGNVITGAMGDPEQGLQVTYVHDPANSSPVVAEVRVQQGFGGALYDQLDEILDALDGPLAIKKLRYQAAMDQIDTRIETQEDRLVEQEERLRAKYARLEASLAQMDSFRAAFDAVFASLETMKARDNS